MGILDKNYPVNPRITICCEVTMPSTERRMLVLKINLLNSSANITRRPVNKLTSLDLSSLNSSNTSLMFLSIRRAEKKKYEN